MPAPDSITQFSGVQVSPSTAEVYGFQLQDAIAMNPRFKFSFTLANLFSEQVPRTHNIALPYDEWQGGMPR